MRSAVRNTLCAAFFSFSLSAIAAEELLSLSLKEAGEAALKNHPRISVTELRALAAKQVTRQAQSPFFPNVSANVVAVGTANDNTRLAAIGSLNNPSIFERNAEGLVVSQLITDFGRTANLTRSAKLHAQGEENNVEATRAQILLQVAAAFYSALQAQSVSLVAAQTVSTRQSFLDQVGALAKNKLRSELDVSFARVNVEEAKLLLSKSQNDLQAALSLLSTLMGSREPQAYRFVDEPMPSEVATNASQYVAQALETRPDLLRVRRERDAALRFAQAERALHYPTISALASAGVVPVHGPQLPNNYAAAGVVLSLPIFVGNLYSARQKEAELRAKAAEETLRDEENTAIRDVRLAWLNAQNAAERLRISIELVKSAKLAADLAQARYNNGISSIVELNQAQLNQVSAEITEANTRYEYLLQRTVLSFQTGTLH